MVGPDGPGRQHVQLLYEDRAEQLHGYQSDKVTDLLEKARGTPQQAERAKLYREAETQLAADAPILFLTFPATLQASTKSLNWLQYPDGALRLQFAKFQ